MSKQSKPLRLKEKLNNKLKIKLIEDPRFGSFQELGTWLVKKYAAGELDQIIDDLKEGE